MAFLTRQTCPTCGSDDDYTEEVEAPGLWYLTCTGSNDSLHPYSWHTTGKGVFDHSEQDGIAAGLGLYDDLVDLFLPNDPWLEYGIVEYRYALAQPTIYRNLVADYGHVSIGPKRYTASSFIGAALGRVHRDGNVARTPCKATGRFSYLTQIHAHAIAPGPTAPTILTWAQFAEQQGFDPKDWPPLMAHPKYIRQS